MNDEEVSLIVNKLSFNLQEELNYEIKGNLLKNCPVIVKNFSEKAIKSMVNIIEEVKFSPEDKILEVDFNFSNIDEHVRR
jgi:potassium voltage-gated channel Eag-related subfamily H protein 7